MQVLYIGSSVNHYRSRTLLDLGHSHVLRYSNSSVDLITTKSVSRSLKLYYIPHCRQSQLLYQDHEDVIYNSRCAQYTDLHQLHIRMYSCTSSLDLCTLFLLWMVVPGLRLDDYIYMYTFIFIFGRIAKQFRLMDWWCPSVCPSVCLSVCPSTFG